MKEFHRLEKQYGIWEPAIKYWGWRQKSKPDDPESPLYDEIVTLPESDFRALLSRTPSARSVGRS